jgi:WD40 repeat protein
LFGELGAARALTFAPDGQLLVVGLSVGVVVLQLGSVELQGGTLPSRGGSCSVAFSTDGQFVAWAGYFDSAVYLSRESELTYRKELHGYRGGILALAHSPRAPLVACGTGMVVRGEVLLWDYSPWPPRKPAEPETGLAFRVTEAMRLRVPPEQPLAVLTPVHALAFDPDGRLLASGEKYGVWRIEGHRGRASQGAPRAVFVRLWDVEAREQRMALAGHGSTIKALAFSPDGRTLLSAEENGILIVWDVVSGRELRRFDWGIGAVRDVAIAPDGMTAAVAGSDRTVLVWDID